MKALVKVGFLAVVLSLASVAVTGAVLADGPASTSLELVAPAAPAVGQPLTLTAKVTDQAKAPVAGVEVVFWQRAAFLNSESDVELGRATTDKAGVATLDFIPRTEGAVPVSAKFAGNAKYARTSAGAEIDIKPGPQQFHQEKGIHIPGVGVWWLVALMAGVWGTFLWAVRQIRVIFHEGQKVASSEWGRHHV